MGKKKRKFPGCSECNHLAKHPWCPLCTKKMHWVGGLMLDAEGKEQIEKSAPNRRIDHRVSIAYLLPFMVEQGLIPKDDLGRVTLQVLGEAALKVVDSHVFGFEWGKFPYKWRVIEADLTGTGTPYIKVRYAGWSCREHKGAIPSDLPALVLERDGYRCVVCGKEKDLAVTYLMPPEEKGRASLGNMTTFCTACIKERGTYSYWSFLRSKGVPIKELLIDFKSGYVRSIVSGNRLLV